MASIRRIKKDIDYLVGEVLSDCYTFMYIYPEKKHDEALVIIQDTVNLRNQLIERTRVVEGKAKTHFHAVSDDLLKGVDSLFSRISELTK